MIYFIRDDQAGAIKIGTAVDPGKRFRTLQIGNPRPLRLLGVIPGGSTDEARLHDRFAAYRVRGEWFTACEGLTDAIKAMIEEFGESAPRCGSLDFTYSTQWEAFTVVFKNRWPELQALIRLRIIRETGIPCSVYRGGEPSMTGSLDRVESFQIMPLQGEPERHLFWGWHVDNNPQWFASPGHAADSWISSFRFWHKYHCVLQGAC